MVTQPTDVIIIAESAPNFSEVEIARAEALTAVAKKQVITQRKLRLKKYAFDATGSLYQVDKYTLEQWEALKRKLGQVIEIEATSQAEAWKKYEESN